jgi:hypothetical protein
MAEAAVAIMAVCMPCEYAANDCHDDQQPDPPRASATAMVTAPVAAFAILDFALILTGLLILFAHRASPLLPVLAWRA